MIITDSQIIVIFGASGDLTKRKLIPSLFQLHIQKRLPEKFCILGTGRTHFTKNEFIEQLKPFLNENNEYKEDDLNSFYNNLNYHQVDTNNPETYLSLKDKIEETQRIKNISNNIIFYFSTPPSMYEKIAYGLSTVGLNKEIEGKSWKRVIIEKPFGIDLESAIKLNKKLLCYFKEHQIYRIDHYLGKETVQNILVTRFANGIFEPLWNSNYIDYVEITASENIGVENRGNYYDNAGALRDMIQNHLLQLVGLVAMESPTEIKSTAIRDEILKVFQSLRPIKEKDVLKSVIRGQYTDSKVKGEPVNGYRCEKDVDKNSRTETFVAMKFFIDNWRWNGVPFYIRTGKRLPVRVTEAVIHFKKSPHHLFVNHSETLNNQNKLIIRIQPDEGLLVKFGMKVPGAGFNVKVANMDFSYSDFNSEKLPSGYERLLMDCMQGDSTLYIRGDSVEQAWKFVQPILNAWKNNPEIPVYGYPAGTWGPKESDSLISDNEGTWRNPNKNLSNDGEYCEL